MSEAQGDVSMPALDPMSPGLRRRHWEVLIVAMLVIVAALLLRVHDNERVAIAGASSLQLPQLCMSKAMFGVDCPGCGLTRSFVGLAHGDWAQSLRFHRIGWLVAAALVLQIPYRIMALRHPTGRPFGVIIPALVGYGMIVALVGNWVLGVLGS